MCLKCLFLLFSVLFFWTLYNLKKRRFSCGGTKEMMPNEVVRVASRGTTCFLDQPWNSLLVFSPVLLLHPIILGPLIPESFQHPMG